MDTTRDELWNETELAYWLAFDQVNVGIGTKKVRLLHNHFHSLKTAWHASASDLRQLQWMKPDAVDEFISRRKDVDPYRLVEAVQKAAVEAYPFYHPLYPTRLREIHDPPMVLYMRGQLKPEDAIHSVAVVGTRRPTSYGTRNAKEFGRVLAANGVTVVSGMAVGVDSLAHWGAIEGGGKTVAVLACGADVCYPSSNKPLYQAIVEAERGAVVSEFFPGTRPEGWRFPARNRIISGLSDAVVVIEAGHDSGSLITARLGFEQNRSIFAVPGRVDSPMSRGTNQLIAHHFAQLVLDAPDVLSHLHWISVDRGTEVTTIVELFGREKEIFELISPEPVHFDYLCEKSGMQPGELSATLTMLELAGIVTRHPGDWYSRHA